MLSLGFKYILHIIAGIFAFSIRNVKVDSLNDFRYVSTYVYISSILITLYIAFVFIAGGRPSLFAGVLIGLLLLEIILLLSLVFVPKVSLLYYYYCVHACMYLLPKLKKTKQLSHQHIIQFLCICCLLLCIIAIEHLS